MTVRRRGDSDADTTTANLRDVAAANVPCASEQKKQTSRHALSRSLGETCRAAEWRVTRRPHRRTTAHIVRIAAPVPAAVVVGPVVPCQKRVNFKQRVSKSTRLEIT